MRTTVSKLRRIIRKTLSEGLNSKGLDPKHTADLKDWITQATEDGMEESFDTTVDSYLEACMDDGDTITREEVVEHLEDLLLNDGEIEDYGDLIINADIYDDEENEDY